MLKKHWEKTVNPSIRIYINKIEKRVTFKIKTWYYLELLTPETMKILGSTKSKLTKDGNDENVSYLEITEVILIHCDAVNNSYQQNLRVLHAFVPNKSLGQLLYYVICYYYIFNNFWLRIVIYWSVFCRSKF